MRRDKYFSIITAYHFGSSKSEPYSRLLRSLRSSLRELENRGRLILVANETSNGAEAPGKVLEDIGPSLCKKVSVVVLARNARNVGALNAGVQMVLNYCEPKANEWIGSIQSSVIVKEGWIRASENSIDQNGNVGAVFGRLVSEDDESAIWAGGHELKEGRTLNVNYKMVKPKLRRRGRSFPCLSAALFKREVVESIVREYGNFVCERLEHFGDCTDVALRAKAVTRASFRFCANAIATKRWPTVDKRAALTSQIVASGLYYKNKQKLAEQRLRQNARDSRYFVDAIRCAEHILGLPYSPRGKRPIAKSLESRKTWRE